MIYLVTGASGFLGSTICKNLINEGCKVKTLCRSEAAKSLVPEGVEIYDGDICDPSSLEKFFTQDEEIIFIHNAAYISVIKRDPLCHKINTEGTKNIVDACIKFGVKKLVYVGSVDALHNPGDGKIIPEPDDFSGECPDSDYAITKREASIIVLDAVKKGLNASICMPAAILGPGDYKGGLISVMFSMYIKGLPPVSLSGGYDMVDVRDVANGIIKASKYEKNGLYVLSGHFLSFTECFDLMAENLGRRKTVITFPAKLLYPLLPVISLYFKAIKKPPSITSAAIRLMVSEAKFSHKRASEDLGYEPRPIESTIKDTVDFYVEELGCKKAK